jgi:hypothetical protein
LARTGRSAAAGPCRLDRRRSFGILGHAVFRRAILLVGQVIHEFPDGCPHFFDARAIKRTTRDIVRRKP